MNEFASHFARQPEEFWLLLGRICDGEATPADIANVERHLHADPAARELFVAYLGVHAQLQWQQRGTLPTVQNGTAETPRLPQKSQSPVLGFLGTAVEISASWLSSPKFLVLTIAGCLGTYFLGLILSIAISRAFLSNRQTQEKTGTAVVAQGGQVGTVRSERQTSWSGAPPANATVRADQRYQLSSGRVEVMLSRGARLWLEGPAAWQLDSERKLSLQFGKLLADVPPADVGFTVVTPTAEIVDLGTSFGVEVTSDDEARVVVTRGAVRVTPRESVAAAPPAGDTGAHVKAGQALTVSRDSERRINIQESRFDDAWVGKLIQIDGSPASTPAEVIAFQVSPAAVAGTSTHGIESLGVDFQVTRPIQIFSLGVFDHLADGIAPDSEIRAELWSYDDQGSPSTLDDTGSEKLAELTFSANDPGVLRGGFRFKRLASPLQVAPGSYWLITHGFRGENKNFCSPLFDALPPQERGIRPTSETETSRYAIVPNGWRFFIRPWQVGDFPPNRSQFPTYYFSGSFTYRAMDEP